MMAGGAGRVQDGRFRPDGIGFREQAWLSIIVFSYMKWRGVGGMRLPKWLLKPGKP
jgi:hypothetical protein